MIEAIVFDAYGTLYDVQSVEQVVEKKFPGRGAFITAIWRMKQLEYSWLRGMMGSYADFRTITKDALAYTLGIMGLKADDAELESLVDGQNRLTPYPEAAAALTSLSRHRLAILSNGSGEMLRALVDHSGLGRFLEAVMSVEEARTFKPHPSAYALVQRCLGLTPDRVLFVSSNGFDVSGAKSFGFTVARIVRVSPDALRRELAEPATVGVGGMFRALRSQQEMIGEAPDFSLNSLTELGPLAEGGFSVGA
jgi:2-haloacid dehalogenase